MTVTVALRNVTKVFGPVTALSDVSLELHQGEVHVLLGENGAGKSTLVKILSGAHAADQGQLLIRGEEVRHHSPAHARNAGINVVLQDYSLAPALTVTENLFLGREIRRKGFLNRRAMRTEAAARLELVGGGIDPDAEVGSLPQAERQLVEIVKALVGKPGVLLLDEPTAAISEAEANRLFTIVDRLRDEGWAMLYITHRMEEVRRVGDRVSVLRDGRSVSSYLLEDVTDERLIRDMVGRDLSSIYPEKTAKTGEVLLSLDHVSTADGKVHDLSLSVRAGEIVAVAGLVGSGKSQLARLIAGLTPSNAGSVTVGGRRVTRPSPRAMAAAGVGFMPEDRRLEGLALGRSIEENITMEVSGDRSFSRVGLLRKGRLRALANELAEIVDIRPRNVEQESGALSGGNQQKLRRLCEQGAGVLMVSSDLEEVVGLADRVYVMNGGRIQVELTTTQINNEAVVAGAFGHAQAS